ncbi:MAG: hypothetical protein H6728_04620 [Myxococcales bacterium]|nr:hypothetical protein [Myxococcales bacterium]MCB9642337.1 hypothetical protein [Myxococcales bacterium]
MRRMFWWSSRLLLCLFLVALVGTSCTCQGSGRCEGEAGVATTDPNGLPCEQRCECNNQAYEGYCISGKCISFARQSCTLIGSKVPCRLSVQVDQQKSCEWGERVCKPPYLNSALWGDCTPYAVVQAEGQDPATAAEQCTNGKDDDCDGLIDDADEGCAAYCKQPGQRRPCYDAPDAQRDKLNLGRCAPGLQLCTQERKWGECSAQVSPAEETCNSVDDDCDGNVDEGVPNCKATICKEGEKLRCFTNAQGCRREADGQFTCRGVCSAGFRTCQGGQFGSCEQQTTPSVEKCGDGLDNNCNGQTDEGCLCEDGKTQECYSGPEDTKGKGACLIGIQSCQNGQWGECLGQQSPTPERCNGLDDDCDGQTDEGCGTCQNGDVRACADIATQDQRNKGVCKDGFQVCFSGAWSKCTGEVAPATIDDCDGLDSDCDGKTDEDCQGSCIPGYARTCPTGPEPTAPCRKGIQVCTFDAASQKYIFGPCQGEIKPTPEICNGIDDDCNGQIDDNCQKCTPGYSRLCEYKGPAGTEGKGVCRGSIQVCVYDAQTQSYDFGPCIGEILPSEEICDGQDNNCDGQVDESCTECKAGDTKACYTGPPNTQNKGTCKDGIQVCYYNPQTKKNEFGACLGEVSPQTEVCNDNIDNNCDGQVDEDCGCVLGSTQTCYSGPITTRNKGTCKDGVQVCKYDATTKKNVFNACVGEVKPTLTESGTPCDGLDNNCDGQVDESCVGCVLGYARQCYTGASGKAGIGICKVGIETCILKSGTYQFGPCIGEVPARANDDCNGQDDDCDGAVDENTCAAGYVCIKTQREDGSTGAACLSRCNTIEDCPNKVICRSGQISDGSPNSPSFKVCGLCDASSDCQGRSCVENVCR